MHLLLKMLQMPPRSPFSSSSFDSHCNHANSASPTAFRSCVEFFLTPLSDLRCRDRCAILCIRSHHPLRHCRDTKSGTKTPGRVIYIEACASSPNVQTDQSLLWNREGSGHGIVHIWSRLPLLARRRPRDTVQQVTNSQLTSLTLGASASDLV